MIPIPTELIIPIIPSSFYFGACMGFRVSGMPRCPNKNDIQPTPGIGFIIREHILHRFRAIQILFRALPLLEEMVRYY